MQDRKIVLHTVEKGELLYSLFNSAELIVGLKSGIESGVDLTEEYSPPTRGDEQLFEELRTHNVSQGSLLNFFPMLHCLIFVFTGSVNFNLMSDTGLQKTAFYHRLLRCWQPISMTSRPRLLLKYVILC